MRPTPRLARIRRRTAATGAVCCVCAAPIVGEAVIHWRGSEYHYGCLPAGDPAADALREMLTPRASEPSS